MKALTITGYSTALFSTWYFINELGILFDAGDGVSATLLQKSRKITHVFLSHADRDHLGGLLQFNQLNARDGFPVICYPRDGGSYPALEAFTKRFDPQVSGTVWMPVAPGDEIRIKDDILVIPLRNEHVRAAPGVIRSLGYKVIQTRRKLRPELAGLTQEDIRKIGQGQGKESTTIEVRRNILSYSGDTPVAGPDTWQDTEILIHEATFLGGEEVIVHPSYKNLHSRLEEVIEMVSATNVQQLILGHFSSRYAPEQIDQSIRHLCERYALNIPVFRILPGQTVWDILKSQPMNG
ncbi:MBL fold metallo-hydrolase [Chitinophaga qingshengii]|uniref:MBL fold metallo-hydrolase n=1 Tax=Chitinophaga qingshengii TaxID=1569794 RepID=A0ABR7TJR5_9BACT|nr:MBL fold metallo-hydrolase [Chitinophaga qingshengii]MBC9929905.1 MBL fold metallo-hydrolase [Chitinophaga qingshengii]